MTANNVSQLVFFGFLGLTILPFLQASAQAIVINNTAGINTARRLGSPFTAVTEVFTGGGLCSGSLIDTTHILTAQHCIFLSNPSDMSVRFRNDDPVNTLLDEIAVTNIFEIDPTNNLLDGTDIAILELAKPAPQRITPFRLLTNTEHLVGSEVTTVGFGLNGVGSEGHEFSRDGRRWAADNILDWVGGAAVPEASFIANGSIFPRDQPTASAGMTIPNTFNIFSTDFDDGTAVNNTMAAFESSSFPLANEGTTAPGDSGSPLLVRRNDEFLIAGVLSGGTTFDSVFGDISWWTGSEQHRSFIEQRGGRFVSTPEASSPLILMALGGVSCGLLWSQKQSKN